MSIFPDRNNGPTKEEVLSGTPYLGTFLNRTAHKLNPDRWQNDLSDISSAIESELEARLGKTWIATTIMPLVAMTRTQEIFHPSLETNLRVNVVSGLVKFGFELENRKNANVVLLDITERLRDDGVFNPLALQGQKTFAIVDACIGLLEVGMYLKRLPPEGVSTLFTSDNPSSDPVRSFIEGLDLTGF